MSRSLNNDHATKAWEDAYAYKAQIEQREAQRRDPEMPILTMMVLVTISYLLFCAVLIFSNGPEPF